MSVLQKPKRNLRALADSKRSKRKQELIEAVKRSSLECGKALMELRDDEHWKDTHMSFREFCEQTFDIRGSYLYELIQAVKIKESLPDHLQKSIVNSKEAIVLSKVPESDRAKAVERYAKLGGKSTPLLREIAQKFIPVNGAEKSAQADSSVSVNTESKAGSKDNSSPNSKSEPVVDWEKNVVPMEALPFWSRRNDFWGHRRQLDGLIETFEKLLVPGDLVREKLPNDLLDRIKQVRSDLMLTEFYCVCPKCHGEPSLNSDGCACCGNTGVISKTEFDKLNEAKASPV